MMASPSELSLDCKPQSYSMLLKSFGGEHNHPTDQATHKLEEYLNRLEEERLKIDAFKRELPLCMQLLTNAMEASRQQLQSFRVTNQGTRPILEEFMPIKHSNIEGSDQKTANISDKANWMVSAQLWSPAGDSNKQQSSTTTMPKSEADNGFSVSSPKLGLDTKQRNGGAFLPFAKERNSVSNNNSSIRPLPDLALASSDREVDDKSDNGMSDNSSKGGNNNAMVGMAASTDSQAPTATTTTTNNTTNQTNRKARRCWSPDLHRRFVNALQMLGGSQVATPKQIRELMKVDGLTNDEVKSHLQKYRLHTRRPSPSPQAVGGQAPQLVVLGGIWVPPEYATAAHGGAPTIYSAHPSTQVTSHYCSPTVPPDFYPQPVAPQQAHPQALHHPALHQHHHHHQLHVYKTTSHTQTHSSPESDAQRAGDRSESIEDGKSDCSSWKGESGENGGEGRKLIALRDDGEESNGSQITLKF